MSASTSWGERVCLLWKCVTGAEEMLGRKGLAVWTEGWRSKPGTSGMLKTCPRKSGFNGGGARGVAQDFIVVGKKSSRTFLSKNAHTHERMPRHQLFCLLLLLWQTFNLWLVRDDMTPNGLVLSWRCTDFERVHGLTEDCRSGFPHCTSFWKTPSYPTPFSFPPLPCDLKWLRFLSSALWRFGENGVKTALCAVLWRKCCFTPRPLRRLHLFSVWLLDVSVGR